MACESLPFIRPLFLMIAVALSWNQFVAVLDPDIKMEPRHLVTVAIATSVALAALSLMYMQYGPILGSLISTLGLIGALLQYPLHRTGLASAVAAAGFLLAHVWTGTD